MDRKKLIKKERLRDAVDILNSIVFLAGAFIYWDQDKVWLAACLFFVGMINLSITEIIKRNRRLVKLVMMVINFIVAGLVSYDYILQGKHYIQFAWLAVALLYLVISIRMMIGLNTREEDVSDPSKGN